MYGLNEQIARIDDSTMLAMNAFTEFLISLPCSTQNDDESDEDDEVVF